MMTILIDRSDRFFQFWAYTVGMGRLLLRSTKSEEFQTRIDVLFQNVKAIKLPTAFSGLVVMEADDYERELITRETGLFADNGRRFYSIIGSNVSGYVVAGVVSSCEDRGEYYEPSELWSLGP